jgi:hypothetical protein
LYRFDAETAATIVSYVQAGAFMETASAAAGISKQTLYSWLKRGKAAAKGALRDWWEEVQKALALSEVAMIGAVSQAAQDGQWQAAAWHLERKWPERYGRRERIEHTGPGGGPIQQQTGALDVSRMTTAEKRAKLQELMERAGAAPLAVQILAKRSDDGEEPLDPADLGES